MSRMDRAFSCHFHAGMLASYALSLSTLLRAGLQLTMVRLAETYTQFSYLKLCNFEVQGPVYIWLLIDYVSLGFY